MGISLDTYLEDINNSFLDYSKKVKENVLLAVDLLITRNPLLIDQVKQNDKLIDQKEIEIEETCIKVIAMYQPKATLLRYLVSIIKVNNDLERISDLAVNMAKSVKSLSQHRENSLYMLPEMVEKVLNMFTMVIQSLLENDSKLALEVCKLDDEVDNLKSEQRIAVSKELANSDSDNVAYMLDVIINGRRLERIADLCTNIAEDVIYINEGEIIRHRKWDPEEVPQ